jgi:hypothetical protein
MKNRRTECATHIFLTDLRSASAMSVDSFLPRARATRSATSMVGLRSPALQETDALITGFKASSGYLFDGGGDQQSTRKLSETRNQEQFRPAKSRPTLYFPSSLAFSGAFLPRRALNLPSAAP